jgi:sarcosine oxidase subunit gamma
MNRERPVADPARMDAPPAATLRERTLRAQINVRGAGAGFRAAVRAVVGCEPPVDAGTVGHGDGCDVAWLGPDEWLLTSESRDPEATVEALRAELAGQHSSVVDLSAARRVFRVAGPRAADVLAKGTTIDLHPRVFGPERCAQTQVGKATVLIVRPGVTPVFDVYVARSFADYLRRWLVECGREFGMVADPPAPG